MLTWLRFSLIGCRESLGPAAGVLWQALAIVLRGSHVQ
jgi:hypothetical protein